ncbi:MAG TPA: aminotransferase class I/II-fold pyridoxal phosphate-dependent enzyme [Thermoanaerobaculia bacterium]
MSRDVVAAMTAYTLELREAEIKLNQNESPNDFPAELKQQILARVAARPWNRYPDFESLTLREALAREYGYEAGDILVGNGSNELLAATIATFVGPGTPVVFPKPTFALYEKLVTIAGGVPIPIAIDPSTGLLPLDAMCSAGGSVIIACSPNNPTGGVLPPNGIEALLATGATVLFDRAYGDFDEAQAGMPALHDRLITFSTFSKAWGLAALRVGWIASTASTCREIRKVKLPYSLNIVSEAIAATALEHRQVYERNVSLAIRERERVFAAMQQIAGVMPCPSKANFIFFRIAEPRRVFDALCAHGVLIREYADALRVSIGNPDENDRFLEALQEVV